MCSLAELSIIGLCDITINLTVVPTAGFFKDGISVEIFIIKIQHQIWI